MTREDNSILSKLCKLYIATKSAQLGKQWTMKVNMNTVNLNFGNSEWLHGQTKLWKHWMATLSTFAMETLDDYYCHTKLRKHWLAILSSYPMETADGYNVKLCYGIIRWLHCQAKPWNQWIVHSGYAMTKEETCAARPSYKNMVTSLLLFCSCC